MNVEWDCSWIDYYICPNYTVKAKDGSDVQCNYIEFFCPPVLNFLDYDSGAGGLPKPVA